MLVLKIIFIQALIVLTSNSKNQVTSCSHFPLKTLIAPTIAFTIDSLERNKKIIGAGRWSTKAAT